MPIPRITDATKSFERLDAELARIERLCATSREIEVMETMKSCSQWLQQTFKSHRWSRIANEKQLTVDSDDPPTGNVALRNTE